MSVGRCDAAAEPIVVMGLSLPHVEDSSMPESNPRPERWFRKGRRSEFESVPDPDERTSTPASRLADIYRLWLEGLAWEGHVGDPPRLQRTAERVYRRSS